MTKRNWTSLLLSNVLLTLPVMFSASVLGYLFADLANWFLHTGFNDSQFPEFVRNDENIRALCVFASIPAGFLVAQICFILKVLRQEEFAPVRFLRFRLVTGLILTCAAAGLLYLNVVEVPVQVQQNFSRVRYGWPFCYSTISTWAGSEPDVTSFHGNIAINALFCLDLLLILLVVLEFFLARRDATSRTAGILPASPSSAQLDRRPNVCGAGVSPANSDTNVCGVTYS